MDPSGCALKEDQTGLNEVISSGQMRFFSAQDLLRLAVFGFGTWHSRRSLAFDIQSTDALFCRALLCLPFSASLQWRAAEGSLDGKRSWLSRARLSWEGVMLLPSSCVTETRAGSRKNRKIKSPSSERRLVDSKPNISLLVHQHGITPSVWNLHMTAF